jgi:hypothetical protein
VSHTLVQKKIKSGHLPSLPDGRISEDMLGTAWRKGAAPGAPEPRKSILATSDVAAVASARETPEQAAERIVFREGRVFDTEAEAKRHKESFLALLRELEYDKEVGAVVEIAESIRQIGIEYAAVRSRLLAIPNKVAPRAALLSSPDEVRALIEVEIVEALKELTLDAGSAN